MKQAQLFSVAVFFGIMAYAMIGFYFLPLANYEGGLTRMSKLPESLFGWTQPQPTITPDLLRQADWTEADVLVIGDSFSMEHRWQSVLVQHNMRVRTETWSNVRNSICEDFPLWVRAQGFKGKHIILEVVERSAEAVVNRSIHCQKMQYREKQYPPVSPPEELPDRQSKNYVGALSVGIQTQLHSLQYKYLSLESDFTHWNLPNSVIMQRIPQGCDWFSHPRCQDVLFLSEDRPNDFDKTMLINIATINSRMEEYEPIWVVVPDKSTVYLSSNKQFWSDANKRFNSPNLLKAFRDALENKTIDLYRGNDTHLSTTGYLMMGNEIFKSMNLNKK